MTTEIKIIKGNIFTSQCQTLVNTVNCVGVMGAGIALEFKYRYPEMFNKYALLCQEKLIQVGKLWIYDVPQARRKILNFPTKNDWKHPSKYEYLVKGLQRFLETYEEKGISSIAFPMLGALNGGLEPEKVLDMMQHYLQACKIPVEIYEYTPEAEDDLLVKLRQAFTRHTPTELEKLTGLKKNTMSRVKDVIESERMHSLIQLHKVKGIGEETLKICFQFAMRYQPVQDIFTIPVTPNLQAPEIKEAIADNNSVNYEHELSLADKLTLTGLTEDTIFTIEKKPYEAKVGELVEYCSKLNINILEFITKITSQRFQTGL